MSLITDTSDRPIEIDGITPGSPGGPPAAASRRTAPAAKPAAPAPALRNGVDVDPDGADRARADEAAARAAGFSPKPPIYQIGTLVNEIGVENFKASRAAHDAKPLLAEAVEKLVSRVEAERRVDRRTAIPALRMHPSGMLGTAADGEAGKQRWQAKENLYPYFAATTGGGKHVGYYTVEDSIRILAWLKREGAFEKLDWPL